MLLLLLVTGTEPGDQNAPRRRAPSPLGGARASRPGTPPLRLLHALNVCLLL